MKNSYFQICLQGFLFWLAYDLSRFPVIPLYAQKLGLPPEAIGFVVAASTLTGMFGKFLAGGLSDALGRKALMVFACLIAAGLPGFYFFADSAGTLIILRLFHGLGTATMGPVGRAFVSDIVSPEQRGNRLSSYTAMTNLGTMAGRSLGGFLLFWGGFLFPFAASLLAGLLALGIALRWPSDRKDFVHWKELWNRLLRGFYEVGQNRVVLVTSLAEAIQYLALGAVDAFLPIYAKSIHLEDWQIGLFYGLQTGSLILMKPGMGWISDRFGRHPQIIIGLFSGALVLWRIPLETSFAALAALVVCFGMTIAFVTSATTALITDVCQKEHYGAAHGVFGTIMDAGHASGPILSGFLIARWGYRFGFGTAAVALVIASLLFFFLVRQKENPA
ncbi:MAG: MFS transporter [Deltaproteobacteria bacterium]|nr:MFS transporter [Deltaproteobacteria bacterium]